MIQCPGIQRHKLQIGLQNVSYVKMKFNPIISGLTNESALRRIVCYISIALNSLLSYLGNETLEISALKNKWMDETLE